MGFDNFHSKSLERRTVILRRQFAASVAFATTIFFLCMENVKSFTHPVSLHSLVNENTFLFVASGLHSMTRKFSSKGPERRHQDTARFLGHTIQTSVRPAMTSMKMVPSMPSIDLENLSPSSVRTTLEAFGGWYNEMDPVAKAPVYEDAQDDYSFVSPTLSWPTSSSNRENAKDVLESSSESVRPGPLQKIRRVAGWFNVNAPPIRQWRTMNRTIL